MRNTFASLVLLIAILSTSCGDKKIQRPTEPVGKKFSTSYSKYNILPCFGQIEGDYVIKTQDEFQALAEKMLEKNVMGNCKISDLPTIDFTNYNLLGTHQCGSGCETYFDKSLFVEEDHVLHYSVKVREVGNCEPWRCSMNWILVDRLPEKMEVKFN